MSAVAHLPRRSRAARTSREEPHPLEDRSVIDTPGQKPEQFRMWDGVEVAAQAGVHDLHLPLPNGPFDRIKRLMRTASKPALMPLRAIQSILCAIRRAVPAGL